MLGAVAVTAQVPLPSSLRLLPSMVQVVGVVVLKLIGRPEGDVALSATDVLLALRT